jgi:Zn-dependent protease
MNWWVSGYLDRGEYWQLYCHCFWVIASICLHELGHGWAAIQQGDSTPRDYKRMTLNPLVHMGGMSLAAFALFGIAWGLMPVNPSRFKWGRWGDVWVSAAGPLVNLILALVLFTTLAIMGGIREDGLSGISDDWLMQALFIGGLINAGLLAFNLLPAPPLDGATILAGLTPATYRFYHSDFMRQFGAFILIVLLMTRIGSLVMKGGQMAGVVYLSAATNLVDRLHGPAE